MRRPAARHRPHRLGALAVAAVLAGSLLAGCSASRVVVGPIESPCYRALPAAKVAVRSSGRFAGVRLSDTATLVRIVHHLHGPVSVPESLRGPAQRVCVVTYRGRFSPAEVAGAWRLGRAPASYAVVVVRESDARTLATLLVDRRPLRLFNALSVIG